MKRQLHCRGEKGREQTGRGQADFQKAVAAYPGYAAAWNELGRVQATLGQSDNARTAGNRQQTAAENVIGHRGYIERRVLIRFERDDATGAMIYANPMGHSSRPSILSNANLVPESEYSKLRDLSGAEIEMPDTGQIRPAGRINSQFGEQM